MHDTRFDPRLHQELLARTGSILGLSETEPPAADELAVLARLDPPEADVPGLRVVARFGSVVTGRVRLADVVGVREHRAVRSLKLARRYGPTLDLSVREVGAQPDALPRTRSGDAPLTGAGVAVAVLDWGLDVTHANLRHPDGSTRVLALWDQRGGPASTSPEPFGYGRVLTREAIDAALRTADPHAHLAYDHAGVDPTGIGTHGTHVTDIAAGNGRAPGSAPGVAPGADILFVHLSADDTRPEDALGDSVRLCEGLAWCATTARGALVVHLSLGRTGGAHDSTPLLVRALDHLLASTPGIAVTMSCGNYAEARLHAQVKVLPGGVVDLLWDVPGPPPGGSELEIWCSGRDRLNVTVTAPNGRDVVDLPPGGHAVLAKRGQTVLSGFHRLHEPNSGATMIDIFVLPGAPTGRYLVRLTGVDVTDGAIHAWIERTAPRHQARFPPGVATPEFTTGSICNGLLPLSVGAYDGNSPARTILPFSSSGPTRDGRPKPELSAPGTVVAARSSTPVAGGGRLRDGVIVKSGTSMAAPHVAGAVALVFEAVAPRLLPMPVTRWILLESARRSPPDTDPDALRYGSGRLDVRRACELARSLVAPAADESPPAPAPSTRAEKGSATTMTQTRREPVLRWLTRAAEQESADGGTAAVGRLTLDGTVVPVAPRGPAQVEFDLDNAVQAGLARTSEHTLVTATGSPPSYRVEAFGPPTSLPAPVVATFDGGLGVQVILLNGGERVLVASERGPIRTRWVDIPGLRSFYHLPPADALRLRTLWADRLASVDPAANRTAALAIPRLRAVLARYGAAAFPVRVVRRGTPSRDRGGIVNGITLPVPGQPVREPRCYLPVIAEVEGRLESVNAWDAGAGISLGPIQFNVDRGALFDFLWRLWTKDPDLFATALTGPLSWTMARHGDHPDLLVARAGRTDTLHGRVADRMTNAAYLQSGQLGSTGFTPGYRRNVAAALRDCVVWPHVQEMVLDVSAEWLEPALADIHAEGIGPLDPAAPDLDTFVLTALLLSARVRYSGCLRPILDELRRWSGAGEKLAHWKDAVKAARSPCPDLETRLGMQDGHARHVYGQLVLPALTAPAAQSAAEATETVDPASAAGVPAAPRTAMVPGLSAKRSAAAQAWNAAQHPAVSGVPGAGVVAAVATHVSLAAATGAAHAAGAPVGTAPFDATAVEAVHQFQAGAFAEAGQRDGKAGPSTLDSLGLVRRTGPNPVAAVNAVGQKRLDAASAEVVARTGGEFTASTWWEGMVNPGWLGLRFRNGIHLELARRLRRAEALLLAQPAYAGMTGVQLGHALGVGEEHKGARPRAATASMHTFGLAVDVAYTTNPWIVGQHVDGGATPSPAGAVTVAANTALTQALNRAALLVHGERVDITAAHLSRLAKGTTAAAWDDLQRRHTALCQYLAAAGDVPAAAALVHANSAVAGVVEPGENIAAAGRRWARSAATDLAELQSGPVTRKNARGVDVRVARSNFVGRDPRRGFLSLHRDLVIALRDGAGLAWGAIDFGGESGDVMHFDCRRDGVGFALHRARATVR